MAQAQGRVWRYIGRALAILVAILVGYIAYVLAAACLSLLLPPFTEAGESRFPQLPLLLIGSVASSAWIGISLGRYLWRRFSPG